MTHKSKSLKFTATPEHGEVSAILDRSETARSLMVLGHGSGSNMHVPLIASLSDALVKVGVATFRYEFPYSEGEDFVPHSDIDTDEPEVLIATVRRAVETAAAEAADLPLFAGGHSLSGQMTSVANSQSPLPMVRGIILLSFPLKGDMERATHFSKASNPMLFLQGTQDKLADVEQIKNVIDSIGTRATLRLVESANHVFKIPDKEDAAVVQELARSVADWTDSLI